MTRILMIALTLATLGCAQALAAGEGGAGTRGDCSDMHGNPCWVTFKRLDDRARDRWGCSMVTRTTISSGKDPFPLHLAGSEWEMRQEGESYVIRIDDLSSSLGIIPQARSMFPNDPFSAMMVPLQLFGHPIEGGFSSWENDGFDSLELRFAKHECYQVRVEDPALKRRDLTIDCRNFDEANLGGLAPRKLEVEARSPVGAARKIRLDAARVAIETPSHMSAGLKLKLMTNFKPTPDGNHLLRREFEYLPSACTPRPEFLRKLRHFKF
jgi:hypothetical protein